jgi:hypothetical protein
MYLIETVPLSLAGLMMLASLYLAVEMGYRGRRMLLKREGRKAFGPDGQDHLLSAVLGLLALLLGFTFSLALSRYESRRDLVLQEANALGTAWLRVQLLEEPARGAMLPLLRQYIDARVEWSETSFPVETDKAGAELQRLLWAELSRAIRTDSYPGLARSVMEAFNAAFDLANSREVARSAHIPARVMQVLFLYALLTMGMLGYNLAGHGKRHRIATLMLVGLLTLALVVILDIERPRTGSIQVSQAPMEALKASLRAQD